MQWKVYGYYVYEWYVMISEHLEHIQHMTTVLLLNSIYDSMSTAAPTIKHRQCVHR
jgi:hypothetical protein